MRGTRAIVLPAVLLVSALAAVPAGAQSPPQGEIAKRFFGAWRYVGTSIDGKPRPGRGAEPKGIIYYDPSGAMAAQIAPDRRVRMAGPEPTPEEAKAALADYVAYFGTYTIDEATHVITVNVEGSTFPNFIGGTQTRILSFSGDEMTYHNPTPSMGGGTAKVTYRRAG